MLEVINNSLNNLLSFNNRNFSAQQRLDYFRSLNQTDFTRKNYMNVFKDISSSTATRDLKKGIELGMFYKEGDNNKTKYKITGQNII
jgi:predicted HTH transcriptional regulator